MPIYIKISDVAGSKQFNLHKLIERILQKGKKHTSGFYNLEIVIAQATACKVLLSKLKACKCTLNITKGFHGISTPYRPSFPQPVDIFPYPIKFATEYEYDGNKS